MTNPSDLRSVRPTHRGTQVGQIGAWSLRTVETPATAGDGPNDSFTPVPWDQIRTWVNEGGAGDDGGT